MKALTRNLGLANAVLWSTIILKKNTCPFIKFKYEQWYNKQRFYFWYWKLLILNDCIVRTFPIWIFDAVTRSLNCKHLMRLALFDCDNMTTIQKKKPEVNPEPSQTSKMTFFLEIDNDFQLLIIFAKSFILHVWLGCEYSSEDCLLIEN